MAIIKIIGKGKTTKNVNNDINIGFQNIEMHYKRNIIKKRKNNR